MEVTLKVAESGNEVRSLELARLVRSAKHDGDRAAFGQLIRKYDPDLRPVAYGIMRSQAAMDDALQEAYVKAYKSIKKLESNTSFPYWLRRIVVTTCLDHLRSRKRKKEVDLEQLPKDKQYESFEGDFALRNALDRSLAQLSDDHRVLIELIDAQSMSYAEVGELLDLKPGTVASRTSRARIHMRELLKLEGVKAS